MSLSYCLIFTLACFATVPVLGKTSQQRRLIYNRVTKTGSTTMISLIRKQAIQGGFEVKHPSRPYFPNGTVLSKQLEGVPNNGVYANHVLFMRNAPKDFMWINVVRDPIDRMQSSYYYNIQPGQKFAKRKLQHRELDNLCGCMDHFTPNNNENGNTTELRALDFNTCIRTRAANNCSLHFGTPNARNASIRFDSQYRFFCDVSTRQYDSDGTNTFSSNCDMQSAVQHVATTYIFVGLTEEMELTITMLEKLLPAFFTGAVKRFVNDRKKSVKNKSLKSGDGIVTAATRKLLTAHSPDYREEMGFYDFVKDLFWSKVRNEGLCKPGKTRKLGSSSRSPQRACEF